MARPARARPGATEVDATGLARLTYLLAPSLTRILRDLEARKLIRRRADPDDLRASLISLTTRGRTTLEEVGARSERIYRAIEARLGASRLEMLMATLAEVEAELAEPLTPEERSRD